MGLSRRVPLLGLLALFTLPLACGDDDPAAGTTATSSTSSASTSTGSGGAGGETGSGGQNQGGSGGQGGEGGRGGQGGGGGTAVPEYLAAFESDADDLVMNDDNGHPDIFLFSTKTGALTLLTQASGGGHSANGGSQSVSLSRNGKYAAFESDATDLGPATTDGNNGGDVFLVELATGAVELVSLNAVGDGTGDSGSGTPSVSDDGRYVAFVSSATNLQTAITDDNGQPDVFVRDMQTGTTVLVSVDMTGTAAANAGAGSFGRYITPDGRFVVFESASTDITSLPDDNGKKDIFVRDLVAGTTTLVSVNATATATGDGESLLGGQVISEDGEHVVFSSEATDLQSDVPDDNGTWDVFVVDTLAGKATVVSVDEAGAAAAGASANLYCSITPDAKHVVFTSPYTDHQSAIADTNGADDIFLRDLAAGETLLASVDATGQQAADGFSFDPYVSSDGQIVAFTSVATNHVVGVANGNGGDVDVYQRDLSTGKTTLLSLSTSGVTAGNSWSYFESLSGP